MHKGLILLFNGKELVEEGAGFGVPIVKYADKTFFSSEATLFLEHQEAELAVVTKIFSLNAVSEKQLNGNYIHNSIYHVFHRIFEALYLKQKKLRPVYDWLMAFRKTVGIKTEFVKAVPRGQIRVTYYLKPARIKIHADLFIVDWAKCREILFLNEQGANFVSFREGSGCFLDAASIGGWSKVMGGQACFLNDDFSLMFSLKQQRNAQLYCGREKVKDRFSWAGLTYSVPPDMGAFDYEIELENHLFKK